MSPTRHPLRALRVLAVSQYGRIEVGGAERYLHETLVRLRRRGLQIQTLHADDTESSGQISSPWRFFSAGFNLLWARQVSRLLEQWRPDVIYAHWSVPGLVDLVVRKARTRGIPVCLVYHSDVTGDDWFRKLLGLAYHRVIGRATLASIDCLLVSSLTYLQASPWLSELNDIPIRYAEPGVDEAMTRARRYDCPPYLLFVGKADVRSKGFKLLYRAWQCVHARFPEVGLTVIGPKPSGDYPGVRFLGPVLDRETLATWYASAMVTVLPSTTTSESFGMVLAEALVAGCPIIGSRIGGISDIVSHGENGYLVSPGDIDALTDALGRIIEDHEQIKTHIASNQPALIQRFDWDRTSDQVESALKSIAHLDVRLTAY